MNQWLKERNNKQFDDKQKYIKENLTYSLNESFKECEYMYKNNNQEPLGVNDATSNLCSMLEAVFLHGLKETFLQMTFDFLDSEADRRPNPNFWSVVLLFLHKYAIEDIQGLSQINTDVGYSRAFIRKSLNECLLSSYLKNIRKSPSTLKSYYQKHAFLYDAELIETVENLLVGTESYVEFNLPCNSSLLNVWNDAPLQLSGLYSAPLRSLPIASGEDIAGSLVNEVIASQNIDIPNQNAVLSDIYSASISNSIFSNSPASVIDEDERMMRLMQKIDGDDVEEVEPEKEDDFAVAVERAMIKKGVLRPNETKQKKPESFDESMTESAVMGNSISGRQSWSEPVQSQAEEQPETESIMRRKRSVFASSIDGRSFESMLEEKQRRSTANFEEVWKRFERTVNSGISHATNSILEESEEYEVVIKVPITAKEANNALQQMVEILCRLSTECGLDSQGFLCKECKVQLGVDFSKATVCGFDAGYYCSSCISPDKYPIPAKIIFNWDFKHYPVNKKAATFLNDYQFSPFLDFKILNPEIYSYIDEMNKLQKLRIQLNFIRAYIFTCSESVINELQKLLYGKEHLYESIHLYSTSDLSLIQNGALEEMLKKIVTFGIEHCLKCALCSAKGFICEYCRKSKVIYPFDVDETYRCNTCGSVSHMRCFDPTITCPKCDRRIKRQSVALEI